MQLLYGHDLDVAAFVCAHTPGQGGYWNCRAIGVLDEGGLLVAGVVYHNWAPEAGVIEMSSASTSRRWLTRKVLDAIFRYPFEDIGCQMVVLRVSERNTSLHRILRAFGFSEVLIPRLRGRDEGEIIFTLTDDAWRSNGFQRKVVTARLWPPPAAQRAGLRHVHNDVVMDVSWWVW